MGVTLYKPGNTHVVRGVKCTLEVFPSDSFLVNLDQGWFVSPQECYPKKVVPKPKPKPKPEPKPKPKYEHKSKSSLMSRGYNNV